MKRFLIPAFFAAFLFGYLAIKGVGHGPDSVFGALGIATGMTAIGWAVARKSSPHWGAVSMTAVAGLMLLGQ